MTDHKSYDNWSVTVAWSLNYELQQELLITICTGIKGFLCKEAILSVVSYIVAH